jgi:phosphinothricin acetyltransferase
VKATVAHVAPVVVRSSRDTDVEAIQAIYAYHVLNGFGTFEEVPPDRDEIARRRAEYVARDLPYLVAEVDGQVVGYAYVAPFRPRSAYRHTVENSVYVDPAAMRRGVGFQLLGALIDRCIEKGYRQMVAVIGDSQNTASIRLHEAVGFMHAGKLLSVGRKKGRWLDSVLMQRTLGDGDRTEPRS